MRRSRKIIAMRRVRWPWWWRWRRLGAGLPAALIWVAALAALSGGYAALAPVVDDWRSAMRPMMQDCRVLRVLDGDTVDLFCPGQGGLRARIVGYDSPELFSPRCESERAAAVQATRVLGTWIKHATSVEVAVLGHDRYGRTLVDMRLSGQRVAQGMVDAGYGRRYFGHVRGGWCG